MIDTYIPDKASITVTKKWEDEENQAGVRPKEVTVQLYGNGEKMGEEIALNEDDHWMYTWNNLEKETDGKVISYTAKETSTIPNYQASVNDEDMQNIIITNTYYQVTVSPATGSKGDSYPNLGSQTDFYLTIVGMIALLSIGGLLVIQSKVN